MAAVLRPGHRATDSHSSMEDPEVTRARYNLNRKGRKRWRSDSECGTHTSTDTPAELVDSGSDGPQGPAEVSAELAQEGVRQAHRVLAEALRPRREGDHKELDWPFTYERDAEG